jgi:hypothetical protein
MGVFLEEDQLREAEGEMYIRTYLNAGSLPKKATKVINEIARTTRATSRTRPIIARRVHCVAVKVEVTLWNGME